MLFDQGEGHILRRQVVPIPNFQTLNPSVYFLKKKLFRLLSQLYAWVLHVSVGPTHMGGHTC
jgi:hypothetical protein